MKHWTVLLLYFVPFSDVFLLLPSLFAHKYLYFLLVLEIYLLLWCLKKLVAVTCSGVISYILQGGLL